MAIVSCPAKRTIKNCLAPNLGRRKVVPTIMNADMNPARKKYGGTDLMFKIVAEPPDKKSNKIDVIRAMRKNGMLAAMVEFKYLATTLFIGRYTANITPMRTAIKIFNDVCMISS